MLSRAYITKAGCIGLTVEYGLAYHACCDCERCELCTRAHSAEGVSPPYYCNLPLVVEVQRLKQRKRLKANVEWPEVRIVVPREWQEMLYLFYR